MRFGRLPQLVLSSIAIQCVAVYAAPVSLPGGSVNSPIDITAYVLSNQDISFDGGYFVVNLPQSGSGVVAPASGDPAFVKLVRDGSSAADDPIVDYTGVISGNGSLTVQSGFNAVPSAPGEYSGGTLVFASPNVQTWSVLGTPSGGHNTPALTIGPNVSVYFVGLMQNADVFPFDPVNSRNIINNGHLNTQDSNTWASIVGSGTMVMVNAGGNDSELGSDPSSVYSATIFDFNSGAKLGTNIVFENQPNGEPTQIETSDIMVTLTKGPQSLADPSTFTVGDHITKITPDISDAALNIQIWGGGIAQFTGIETALKAGPSKAELAPALTTIPFAYNYGPGAFGAHIMDLVSLSTWMLGDGREIVNNPDGVTNNAFWQGNPFNTLISANNFVSAPPPINRQQAVALNYSGTYRFNINMNARATSVGYIDAVRNPDWVNFIIVNPSAWNPAATHPNHPIVTVPVFFAGETLIENNAILQLGDGTKGNDIASKTTIAAGRTVNSRYNDSLGNGTLMTLGNQGLLVGCANVTQNNIHVGYADVATAMNSEASFQIVNNGKLLVYNTQGAFSTIPSDGTKPGMRPAIANWVTANELDGISGTGSVEQQGNLPLTLGAITGNPNSYTGGTLIDAGAILIVGSASALGRAVKPGDGTGAVVNRGTLRAAPGVRTINVPGNYQQF